MSLFSKVPSCIQELVPYSPGKPIDEVKREYDVDEVVKLASNESPIGPSPLAINAVKKVLPEIHLYPDGSGHHLKKKLSKKLNVESANIMLGNGSNEIIELVARAFINEGDEAVMAEYAFIVYQSVTKAVGGKPVVVAMEHLKHDLNAMAAAVTEKTRVIFVANPNNPTGTAVTEDELATFLKAVPENVLILIDGAYYEYGLGKKHYKEAIPYLSKMKNLIILRTFSKAYGLAGLRVGYSVASKEIISLLEGLRQPFNVNSLALVAAEAALDDNNHLEKALKVNREGMIFLSEQVTSIGLSFVESFANFILIDVERDGGVFSEKLLHDGVIVRPMNGYGLSNYIRVTVGLPDENKRFIKVLKEHLA